MKWISSAGGPLIVLPDSLRSQWQGVRAGGEGATSDYELACGVDGYVGVIRKEGHEILVLGDEPLQTAVARLGGRPCLVRWAFAPSVEYAESVLADIDPGLLQGPLEYTEVRFASTPLVVMDSGDAGAEANELLHFEVKPGNYSVRVYRFAPSVDAKFLVHEFVPRAARSLLDSIRGLHRLHPAPSLPRR